MVLVPAPTMLTTPVLEIVTTDVFEDVQGVVASAVSEPVNVTELPPTQALSVPDIVGKVPDNIKVGDKRLVVEPSPNCPLRLYPQAHRLPFAFVAIE